MTKRKASFQNKHVLMNFYNYLNESFFSQFLDDSYTSENITGIYNIYDMFEEDSLGGYDALYNANHILKQDYIYENLNYSSSSEDLFNALNKLEYESICDINFKYDFMTNWKNIMVLDQHIDDFDKTIKRIDIICHNYKWYYQRKLFTANDRKDYTIFVFNPIYGEELTEFIYEKLNGIVYHFCPCVENPNNTIYDKLMNKGLLLKSQNINDNYPVRTYFYLNISDRNKEIYAKNLHDRLVSEYKKKHIKFYYLLKVNLNKNNYRIRLFKDTKAQNAAFTMDNIHPRCLEIIDKIYV